MEEVKLLISHGGTIKFHRGKNQHVYHGGRNRMLQVPRNISFKEITAVLSAMCGGGSSVGYFKYQIDGFDLDTLVSVTNERDLRNMMREFDYAKPDSVMRIFLFLEHRRHPRVIQLDRALLEVAFPSPRAAWTCCFLLVTTVMVVIILLQQNSVMDVDHELKSVEIVAELGLGPRPGPDHSLNNQQWHIIQPLPFKAAGGVVTGFDQSNAADFYVFINFRGKDTLIDFVCHLHEALIKQEIKVLIDNKLPKGQKIWPSLLIAIESSHLSVIVFSQHYASSKWCLEELVKILETMKQRVQNWKTALNEAADLIGWGSNSPYIRDDADLIQKIVKDVLEKKNHHCKYKGLD